MAVFAKNCPDIQIKVVDINSSKIDSWNSEDFQKSLFMNLNWKMS